MVDFYRRPYDGNPANVLDQAIGTLQVLRAQMVVMRSAPEDQRNTHNAIDLGVDAHAAGLVEASQGKRAGNGAKS